MKIFNRMTEQIKMLYANRIIMLLGGSLTGLFFFIYIYENLGGINGVLYYSLLSYGLMIITTPIGAMIMSKFGQRNSLIASLPFLTIFYLALIKLPVNPILYLHIALAAILIYKSLYWVPFNTDFAIYSDKKTRGTAVALLSSISYLISIVSPILSAIILINLNYTALFSIVLIINGLSVIPLLALHDKKEEYSWTLGETFRQLFKKANRKMLWSYMADGAENMVGVVIWPIFLFQLLNGEYLSVGILSSVIMLISVFLQLLVGKSVDKGNSKSLLKIGSALYSIGWVVKIFVTTALQVFLASIYHNFALILLRTPFDAIMFEKNADKGSYVDEYTVLRELALGIGRLLMIVVLFLLLNIASLQLSFLLAAGAVLFFNLLAKND